MTMFKIPTPTSMRDLELMSYEEKVRYWAHAANPWQPGGNRVKFGGVALPKSFRPGRLEGNILSMPTLIGWPCFGIATARLRYRDAKKFVKGRGVLPNSRCQTRCPVQEECERIVQHRIEQIPALKRAYDSWMQADGPRQMKPEKPHSNLSGSIFRVLALEAEKVSFTSVNDQRVAEHYHARAEEERARASDKKRSQRRKQLSTGELDEAHVRDLSVALNARLMRLKALWDQAQITRSPPYLAKLPKQSLVDLGRSWFGRELLKAQKQKHGATHVARWILDTKPEQARGTFDALVTRVSKDLNRIADFERRLLDGEPIWPAFVPSREFKDVC